MNAAIILAAGASSRLGQPKQLLVYGGKTLLRHAVDEVLAAGASPVIVVLGAAFGQIEAEIRSAPVLIIENRDWQKGIGTSIVTGIRKLNKVASHANAAWLLLCDQPYVTRIHLRKMQALAKQAGKGIVASSYDDTAGVPLFIAHQYFDDLLRLPDAVGAKLLLSIHEADVAKLLFPDGATDIDTIQDFADLAH